MRLSEYKGNWRASGIIKRDYRHSHDDIEVKLHSKKNTAKWCFGKPGKEHDIYRYIESYDPEYDYWWSGSRIHAKCLRCKKEFYGGKMTRDNRFPLHILVIQYNTNYAIKVRHGKP